MAMDNATVNDTPTCQDAFYVDIGEYSLSCDTSFQIYRTVGIAINGNYTLIKHLGVCARRVGFIRIEEPIAMPIAIGTFSCCLKLWQLLYFQQTFPSIVVSIGVKREGYEADRHTIPP